MIRLHAIGLCAACAISSPAIAGEAKAAPLALTPYVAAIAGAPECTATSNGDQLECGSEAGPMGGLAVGARFRPGTGSLGALVELQGSYSANAIHGFNPHGERHSADHMNGNTAQVGALMVVACPTWSPLDRVELRACGGIGGAHLSALQDTGVNLAWQAEALISVRVTGRIRLGAGYRWFQMLQTRVAGLEAEVRTRGPVVRVSIDSPWDLAR